DIDEAMDLLRQALALQPPPHPTRGRCLNNLAAVIRTRFEHHGDLGDIDEAIELLREALGLHEPPHPDRGMSLNNIADAVKTRFHMRGDPRDINEAIELHREALTLHEPSHPDHGRSLTNLGSAVKTRFDNFSDPQDINEAVELQRRALALYPQPHPNHSISLNYLADAVRMRFEHRGHPRDIDEAIELLREALALRGPPHPKHSSSLYNLAAAIQSRFEYYSDHGDINETIDLALHEPPPPDHDSSPKNLLVPVQIRPEPRDGTEDIYEAIKLHRQALDFHVPPHPARGFSLTALGICLAEVYRLTNDSSPLDNALELFKEASIYLASPLLIRFQHTVSWATTAARYGHISALTAYSTAIELLPQLAALHLELPLRQQMLSTADSSGLASRAASCAVGLGQCNLAVEFLEASRSIFWSQAIHFRTPLDDLATVRSDLSARLIDLSSQLEQGAFRDIFREISTNSDQHQIHSVEAEGARYRSLNEEWDETIKSVRMLPGFDDFMQPKSIRKLQRAVQGPIVVLHCGEASSNALVINTSEIVQCVPLPKLSLHVVQSLVDTLDAASSSTFINIDKFLKTYQQTIEHSGDQSLFTRLTGTRERSEHVDENDILCCILGLLWDWMVLPIFGELHLKKSSSPPRLWWCPTGSFTFLPIHAAGIYRAQGTDCVSDYVVSSYTPTLTALLDPPPTTSPAFKMTAVIQVDAPDSLRLPGAQQELEKITDRVPNQWLTALGNTATVKSALTHLHESAIVHFACHGIQDLEQPLNSGLILTDGRLKVSEIMHRPENGNALDVKKFMTLAFLSACETAKGDAIIPDEAMHLAATLMFSGFRGVVATMWTMADRDGHKIADIFYKHLFENCDPNSDPPVLPDLTRAAEALQLAVGKLREEPDISFKRWVPFVHYGL
ncbi:CHAT domain-containing protein, partial [Mycena leptocephala]